MKFFFKQKKIIDNKRKKYRFINIAYNFVRLILFSKRKYNFIILNSKVNIFKNIVLKLFKTQFIVL